MKPTVHYPRNGELIYCYGWWSHVFNDVFVIAVSFVNWWFIPF